MNDTYWNGSAFGDGDVDVSRCPECDAGEPCQMVPYPYASARTETGDGAEGAPSPMRGEPAPSPDDPHGACSRVLLDMAQERDKAWSASAASERAYREARAGADDNLSRLLDCREVVRSLTAERDVSSDALARSKRECDGISALAGEALERALVAEARLVEATAQIKRLATDRDASRTAHAALVAELRALCDEWDETSFVYIRHVRGVLDRHTAGA